MLSLIAFSLDVQVFEVTRVLLSSKVRHAKKVVLVKAIRLAFLQTPKDQIIFDLLRPFDDVLNRQKFKAELLIFHVLQTLY